MYNYCLSILFTHSEQSYFPLINFDCLHVRAQYFTRVFYVDSHHRSCHMLSLAAVGRNELLKMFLTNQ